MSPQCPMSPQVLRACVPSVPMSLNVPMSPERPLSPQVLLHACVPSVSPCPLSVPCPLVTAVSPQVLLRARAIECQCYVVAAAQTGRHNASRASFGHSLVADPWGTVLAQCQEGPGLCLAHIDLSYLDKVRRELPVHGHRRGDIYGTPGGT